MARARRRRPTLTTNSIVASAARLQPSPGTRTTRPRGSTQEWQQQAWYYYDTCGELAFATGWQANALSRVRLYVQRPTATGGVEEVTAGPAVDVLASLFGGATGQSQMMAAFGVHMFIPGECYLIGTTDPETDTDVWGVYSTDEVKETSAGAGRWEVNRGDGDREILDTSEDAEDRAVVIRIWRSHPRMWVEATSPCRAVLPVLRELEGLTKHVGATIDSRLAGAGILAVPSEMTFSSPGGPPAPDGTTDPTQGGAAPTNPAEDPFLRDLTDAMLTAIGDRDSAAAVVPVVVKAPGALLSQMQHITFTTPLDEKALALRDECIRRLALGLDMPPEVLLGQADSNHWSAWQIDEDAIKLHVEPLCELLCDALTRKWFWPVLEAQGTDPTGLTIAADTSDLRLRPDHSADAVLLYDRMELSGDSLRRETGFDDGDAPEPQERQQQLLLKVATASLSPELAQAALEVLGVPLTPEPAAGAGPATAPAPAAPAPPQTGPPQEQAAALLAAAEPLVYRAIERANNRVNNRAKPRRPIEQHRLGEALAGAWDPDLIGRVAGLLNVDGDEFTRALDQYTRAVLETGEPHMPHVLATVLTTLPPRLRAVPDG